MENKHSLKYIESMQPFDGAWGTPRGEKNGWLYHFSASPPTALKV